MRWLLIALIGLLAAPLPATAQRRPSPVLTASGFSFFPDADRAPVPYQTVKGRVVFRAKIGGREVWALLDNGADRTLIDLNAAQSAGYRIDTAKGLVFGAGGGSLVSQWVAEVPVSIAGQFEAKMPMLALDMTAAQKILGYKIELVVGGDTLLHMALRIDPFARTFHLTPTGRMDGVAPDQAIALRGKRALVEIQIGGKPATVGLDLGSNGGLTLTPAAWARLGAIGRRMGTGRATGATGQSYDVEMVEIAEMGIGSHSVADVSTVLDAARPGSGDGILGMEVLGRFVIVLDLGAGKLWLIDPERRVFTNPKQPRP
ncbi:pepsin/retropepsin-like aspartic protease family protein [Sphingomonas sp. LB-2]|uniref:pepsin/retropepsin-like aspartic protease family protein n=1 Tax=Sphingomonas caeni TaxID=2984949 RepID=UPI00222E61D0|nr:pepsin/retropepsin-like aspartic protease family protein [Sphingomonas caeni]MCW3847729.1 pepsin/retropepsin-like aspartic protease family protein [Sphingomonas caeni]